MRSTAEKKIPFKVVLLTDKTPGHPRALVATDNEINVLFVTANTASFQHLKDRGVIMTSSLLFKKVCFVKLQLP